MCLPWVELGIYTVMDFYTNGRQTEARAEYSSFLKLMLLFNSVAIRTNADMNI
jgi:hypothetical protein